MMSEPKQLLPQYFLLADTQSDIADLIQAIRKDRHHGVLHVQLATYVAPYKILEQVLIADFAMWLEMIPLSIQIQQQDWVVINETQARIIMQSILHKDLAYEEQMMSQEKALEYVENFLKRFQMTSKSLSFFTNGNLLSVEGIQPKGGWTPVTGATFDTGVFVVSPTHIGVFWVSDED